MVIAAGAAAISQGVSIETIAFDEGYGITTSVPLEGTTYTADEDAEVSFTAVGDNFECWFDGAGNTLGTDRTLTFTATADTKIIPFYGKVPWKFINYKKSSGTYYGVITNMYGSLPTDYKTQDNFSVSVTSSGYLSVSYVPILD